MGYLEETVKSFATELGFDAVGVASVLVMLGILAMRYTMLVGGQTIPLC